MPRLRDPLLLIAVALIAVFGTWSAKADSARTTARTLHVAPDGNDDNPGTAAKPFATLRQARDAVRKINQNMTDDIVVILHGGVYTLRETLIFESQDSGTGGHKIVYRAARGQTPVISGGKAITGWQPDTDGRWKAQTDLDNFRQLYIDGVRAVRARGGPLPDAELFGKDGYKTTALEMAEWKNPKDIEFCYQVIWNHTRCKVESITRDGDHASITMLQPHFTYARNMEGARIETPSYIENALELLDDPGEWYFDRAAKTVYYLPKPGQDMSEARVVVPAIEKLVELRGTLDKPVENIHFVGITFTEADWLQPSEIGFVNVQANFRLNWKEPMWRGDHVTALHNEQIKSPANVVCHAAKGLRFERCTFTRLGAAGIDVEFGSQNNIIAGCRFYDISGSAIQIGDVTRDDHHPDDDRKIVKGNAVVNNYIHDCCVEYMGGVGVFAGYTDSTIIGHNEICRLPYSGISVGWGWGEQDAGGGWEGYIIPFKYDTPTPAKNNCIEYNHIHHVMHPLRDGGAIYTLGNMPGTIIRGNHIHDNPGLPGGGIYLDEGSGFIEITNNVVYNAQPPMKFNNRHQNRIATCNEHNNWFGNLPGPSQRCEGKVGLALLCDGVGSFASLPHSDKLDPKQLTVEAWIYLTEYPGGDDPRRWIVNKNYHDAVEGHYALVVEGKKAAGFLNIGGDEKNCHRARSGEVLELDQWHHLAMTYDGSVLRFYLDGREAASEKIDKPRVTGNRSFAVGRREDQRPSNCFFGKIDEVRLYERALSAAEVKTNAKVTGSAELQDTVVKDGLVVHLDFDTPPTMPPEFRKVIDEAGLTPEYRDLLETGACATGKSTDQ
ncbi:MAG: hypothetical protein GXY44_07480 [Phycisphaerales bacterium]|nr:hypothetical protein [Phycisphaerales bacterium]